jgi:hypothetical protein
MRSVWRNVRLLGLVAVLVFVAAACRSSKNESSNQTSGGGAAQQTTGGAAATSGTGTAGAKLTASDVGVTPTEIVLGANYPLTGPAASYSAIPKAIQAYFAYINDQGGVNGRKITFKTMDDAYDPSKTVAVIRQLVDQQKVFAVFNSLGTPTHSAVYDYLNEQKVPEESPVDLRLPAKLPERGRDRGEVLPAELRRQEGRPALPERRLRQGLPQYLQGQGERGAYRLRAELRVDGDRRFVPGDLDAERGRRGRLHLGNPQVRGPGDQVHP